MEDISKLCKFCNKNIDLEDFERKIRANEREKVIERVDNLINAHSSGFVGTYYYNLIMRAIAGERYRK